MPKQNLVSFTILMVVSGNYNLKLFIYKIRKFLAFEIDLVSLNEGPIDIQNDCEVIVAQFRIESLYISLANIMLNKYTDFTRLNNKIKDFISEKGQLLVFIDFSKLVDSPGIYFVFLSN